jgi:hypothetical protein
LNDAHSVSINLIKGFVTFLTAWYFSNKTTPGCKAGGFTEKDGLLRRSAPRNDGDEAAVYEKPPAVRPGVLGRYKRRFPLSRE